MAVKKKKVGITDTTLRDAHQSLWATRMTTEEMLPIAPAIDEVGFWSVEMWGGATFDVCLRFLDEDPWERLRKLRQKMKNTKFQMLLRGQNLVGYRHYPDDIVRRFVRKSVENGIDIFRVFDALNDVRNLSVAIEEIKKAGGFVEAAIVYTISPIHTEEHYIQTLKSLLDLEVDSIAIKDMAGILRPQETIRLVKAFRQVTDKPIHLHCHYIGGMATMNYIEGIEAGADIVDTASFPLAFGNSQPATEVVVAALKDGPYDTGLDLNKLYEIAEYFEEVRKRRGFKRGQTSLVHMRIFSHQIPGGMISNLYSQLEQQRAADRIDEVLKEVPLVRAEVGYPPLVTPLSQIVGTQAVLNVLSGKRWSVVSREMRDYIKGLYGRPPGPISEEIKKKVLRNDDEIIDVRPGALLTKTYEDFKEEIGDLAESEEDVLSYALFPKETREFLERRKRYEQERYQVKITNTAEVDEEMNLEDIKKLIDYVEDKDIAEVAIEKDGVKIVIRKKVAVEAVTVSKETEKTSDEKIEKSEAKTEQKVEEKEENWIPIKSSMVGTFYRSPSPDAPPYVEVGTVVKPGDVVCLIEAMKMFNEITAEEAGVIKKICVENAQPVEYGQVLFYYEPLEGEA
ncbi:MAG: acetyl-CoA carboxylase biotin carboxyl carrier protein [Actinobacteria bacterium]|nr:acetyl-CoA carboxylase biotin carboxyl carrier protein [Actinomycetota bacterium]